MTIRPPTPETISIIIVLSGSTITVSPALNVPAWSHVHAVEKCASCDAFEWSPRNDQTAPANATKPLVVDSHAAVRREIRVPQSVIRSAPASGAARQSHAPAI